MAGGYLKAREPWRSPSITFHSSSLEIAWCLVLEDRHSYACVCSWCQSLPHCTNGQGSDTGSQLAWRKALRRNICHQGWPKSSSATQFFSKDMCLLVLQLLFPAKLSLIPFVLHYVYMCLCGERGTSWLSWVPVVPSHVSSLGYINGAWRWDSDTFQWTTAKKTQQTILGLPRCEFNSSYKHQTNYSTPPPPTCIWKTGTDKF